MKSYYYVYRVNYNPPMFKHETIESAHEEAKRLAIQHPGASFEILKCVGVTGSTVVATTFWAEVEGENIAK